VRIYPYIVIYEVNTVDEAVIILGVFHAVQEERDI